jgi:hypothetical protein
MCSQIEQVKSLELLKDVSMDQLQIKDMLDDMDDFEESAKKSLHLSDVTREARVDRLVQQNMSSQLQSRLLTTEMTSVANSARPPCNPKTQEYLRLSGHTSDRQPF